MTNLKINTFSILIVVFSIVFSACSKKDLTNYMIFNDWENVEKSYFENDAESLHINLEFFHSDFDSYKNTQEYKTSASLKSDLKIHNDESFYSEIITNISETLETISNQNLGAPELKECIYVIHQDINKLQNINNTNSITTVKQYIFILTTLVIIIMIISTFLYVILNRYEKEAEDLKELNTYSQIMITGIEKERKRISKELHDTIVQNLKAIQLANEEIENENELIKVQKEKIKKLTNESIKQLRDICHNLNPPEINSSSTLAAILTICDQFQDKTKIKTNIKVEDNLKTGTFSPQQTLHLLRIIQEILNNIEMHAEAENVSILIRNKEKNIDGTTRFYLLIFIMDDGKGIDEKNINKHEKHFGLENMKERARLLGGSIDIISEIDEGTEITLEVPVNE